MNTRDPRRMRLAIFDFDGTIIRGNSCTSTCARSFPGPARLPVLLGGLVLAKSGLWQGARLRRSC